MKREILQYVGEGDIDKVRALYTEFEVHRFVQLQQQRKGDPDRIIFLQENIDKLTSTNENERKKASTYFLTKKDFLGCVLSDPSVRSKDIARRVYDTLRDEASHEFGVDIYFINELEKGIASFKKVYNDSREYALSAIDEWVTRLSSAPNSDMLRNQALVQKSLLETAFNEISTQLEEIANRSYWIVKKVGKTPETDLEGIHGKEGIEVLRQITDEFRSRRLESPFDQVGQHNSQKRKDALLHPALRHTTDNNGFPSYFS